MIYHFKIHREGKGYWAECIELDGCVTQADTMDELRDNMHEALNLHLSEPENSKVVFPFPKKRVSDREVHLVKVDPKVALAMVIRQMRVRRGLKQIDMMRLLGFKNLYSYQRLESGDANPELLTLARIKEEFPELKLDEVV